MRILPILTATSIVLFAVATTANAQMSNGNDGTMGQGNMGNNMGGSMMHKHTKMHKKMNEKRMMMKRNNNNM